MKIYKYLWKGAVYYTKDKIYADFMNKRIGLFQKFLLLFRR